MDSFTYQKKVEQLVEKVENWAVLSEQPIVSVWMITYNHDSFIRQALDGILMQQVSFPYEVVIGEDKSTDHTRDILLAYQKQYSDRIRLRLSKENLYSQKLKPGIGVMNACRGKYIALCEGDDYWTDPLKLQKQVDFLEAHPECSMCFHNVQVVYEDENYPSYWFHPPGRRQFYHLQDVLKSTITQTSSLIFRKEYIKYLPEWYYHAPHGDWALNVHLAEHGELGYLNETMSTYRQHSAGVWAGANEYQRIQQKLQMYFLFNAHFENRYADIITPRVALCHYELAVVFFLQGQYAVQEMWMKQVMDKLPCIEEEEIQFILGVLFRMERQHGYDIAENVLNWTCSSLKVKYRPSLWSRKLRGEWFAAHTFSAHKEGQQFKVRRMAKLAFWNDWTLMKNLGFLSVWLWGFLGDQKWETLRLTKRRIFQSTR